MYEEKKTDQNSEAREDRSGSPMPCCCGSMGERMFEAISEASKDSSDREGTPSQVFDWRRLCASMKGKEPPDSGPES